jgi:hypothetical protein
MRFSSHLSYAKVISTIALLLALGGSAYAAVRITGDDIVNGTITGGDIQNGSLGASKLRGGALPENRRVNAPVVKLSDPGPFAPGPIVVDDVGQAVLVIQVQVLRAKGGYGIDCTPFVSKSSGGSVPMLPGMQVPSNIQGAQGGGVVSDSMVLNGGGEGQQVTISLQCNAGGLPAGGVRLRASVAVIDLG